MSSKLHSVFSPSRLVPANENSPQLRLPQNLVATFLLSDSDEESGSVKQEKSSARGPRLQETSSTNSLAPQHLTTEIKAACSAAAAVRPDVTAKKSGAKPSSRVAHVYGKASTTRTLHLRTTSSDGDIITHCFNWNTSDPITSSAEDGIPRPDSPTI
ncbi:uncharacterized protein ColSpa_12791 [Colletotrichum spaethianum]|uniref:Uncharacterized protein n=1 Tax=Colletotrichum spaethianum TaxID=700344 RepID=A0AA37PHU5_9PEZI|nr:uncharacterized protein ColSpa_12791 [Colletotrichum spaethianum]GKT52610.1 hypothetical protein ColSpa_12791 [Colletotrichum spaethianum]